MARNQAEEKVYWEHGHEHGHVEHAYQFSLSFTCTNFQFSNQHISVTDRQTDVQTDSEEVIPMSACVC